LRLSQDFSFFATGKIHQLYKKTGVSASAIFLQSKGRNEHDMSLRAATKDNIIVIALNNVEGLVELPTIGRITYHFYRYITNLLLLLSK
jgi:hypothetical protein